MLDEIVRDGARQMLAAALQAEVAAYIDTHRDQLDARGRRLVVRNGHHQPREVTTAAGAVEVRQPRVHDRRIDEVSGERRRFSSAILPAWSRKSPRVAEVLPLLYLHGLSSSDFGPALEQFLGSDQGLSAATITRLAGQWQDEARAFNARSLAGSDYVYCWVDGIHLKVRLKKDKVCLLVIIGVRSDGRKELVALADGFRESSESWPTCSATASVAAWPPPCWRSATVRSASGKRSAMCSQTQEQRCWWHKTGNVLAALPKSAHPSAQDGAGRDLQRRGQDPRRHRRESIPEEFGAKWPKAAAKITDDLDVLLAFYDYPAEHWIHLRTTNPIESTFATVRLQPKSPKAPARGPPVSRWRSS